MAQLRIIFLALACAICGPKQAMSQSCAYDETQGEVQGASGYLCASRCDPNSFACANPAAQCMLKDVDQSTYCAVLCGVDSQCPTGSRCNQAKQMGIGVCLFPTSFSDWVRGSSSAKKFQIGWARSAGVGGALPPLQVTKGYNALQSLKSKFIITDADPDIVTLNEFLATLSRTSGAITPGQPVPQPPVGYQPGMVGFPNLNTGVVNTMATLSIPSAVAAQPPPPTPSPGGWFGSSAVGKDVNYFTGNMMGGIPGIQRELHDTVWNIEHLEKYGVATELLRSIVLLFMAYLLIGCLVNSQMHGAGGKDMIPHVGFWMEYPQMVADGWKYLQILMGFTNRGGFSSGSDLSGGLSNNRGGTRSGVGAFDAL